MASSHSEVQEFEAGNYQDIEDSDIELEAAWAALGDGIEAYTGDGYVTARNIIERYDESESSARKRAAKAVKKGTMVEVMVQNTSHIGGHKHIQAWVPTKTYNEWEQTNDANRAEK